MMFIRALPLCLLILLSHNNGFGNLYNKGKSYLKQGKDSQAKEAFYRYYKKFPNRYKSPFAYYEYIKLLSDPDKIIESIKYLDKKYPNFPNLDRAVDQLATLHFMLGHYNESYYYYDKLVKFFSRSTLRSKAYYFLVKILILNEQYIQARQLAKKALKKIPRNKYYDKVDYLIAETYILEGKYGLANTTLVNILNSYPNSHKASLILLQLGNIKLKLNDVKQARSYFKRMVRVYPASIESIYAKRKLKQLGFVRRKRTALSNASYKVKNNRHSTIGNYYIQAGVFSSKNNALIAKEKCRSSIFDCNINTVTINNRIFYKVIIGPFQTRDKAKRIKKFLNQKGVKSIVKKN